MAGSTIGPARQHLYAALAAWSALSTVQVVFGDPLAYEEQRVVALQGTSDPREDTVVLGEAQAQRGEQYILEVGIKSHDPAGTAETVDADGYAIASAVADAVLADTTLGGVVMWALPAATVSVDGAVPALSPDRGKAQGWVIFLTVRIACNGRRART